MIRNLLVVYMNDVRNLRLWQRIWGVMGVTEQTDNNEV